MTKSFKAMSLSPGDLTPNPWNSNFVSPEHEVKLEESVSRFGLFKPVIVREVDGKLEILGGEHRWHAAKKLGLAKIPVFNLGEIDDIKAREISLADNARYGVDDSFALAEVLERLKDQDVTSFLPLSDLDVNSIFASSNIALDDLELPEEYDREHKPEEPLATKVPKTHTIMRFKVSIADAEAITKRIEKAKHHQGFTSSDDLTNAGDALVHLLAIDE